jgi:aldehyde:ferredoxin oxidoreductase
MYGWTGTILRVNLTTGAITREALDMELARQFIGGRGLGAKYLVDEVAHDVDALGPQNKLIFVPGPLTGSFAPSMGRYDVVTKSPLNGSIASSNSGGSFGPALKFAGYDMIIFEGQAPKPSYLMIEDDKVELRNAADLWGKLVPDVTDIIRAQTHEEATVACIGPAGEKLSPIASIMNNMHRAAGRSGVGAVMGSKNLKAVAVIGSGTVHCADGKAFEQVVQDARAKIAANPVSGGGLPTYGTDVLVNILNETGGLPTRNFQDGYFPTASKVGGETLRDKNLIRNKGCFACVISCGRVTSVKSGPFKGEGEGPEYETAWGFGPDCGVDNLDAVLKANYLCNEYGIDTISASATIACAMELFERGIITTKDTDGVRLSFGNAEAMVEMVRKMGLREGFGDKLALGSYRLAELYGHPEYSMTAKKQEMPAYDPRAVQGIGLNYATSNRGGCHVRGYTIASEILGIPMKTDNLVTEGKAGLTIIFQNLTAALSSTGACLFTSFAIGAAELAALVSTMTGVSYTADEFMQVGDRIYNLERVWNMRVGYTAADDTLPQRLLTEALKSGAAKGNVSRLGEMMPEYYQLRGWDEHGVPTPEKLEAVGLGWLVESAVQG